MRGKQTSKRPLYEPLNALVDFGWMGRLSPTALKVYLVYLRHAAETGVSYPGNAKLAAAAGHRSKAHVRAARAELEKAGLISRVSTGGRRAGDTSRIRVAIPPHTDSGKVPGFGAPSQSVQVPESGARP